MLMHFINAEPQLIGGGGPGGIEEADAKTYQRAVKLLNDNICQLDDCWEVLKIEKVSKQVVAGMLYQIKGIFREI